MFTYLKWIKRGILEVLFPNVCIICSLKLAVGENYICRKCSDNKFELANSEYERTTNNILLPEGVVLQHALWNFDKGGHLQDVMHHLKYNRLTGLGEDLGVLVGQNIQKHPLFKSSEKLILIPVPLHPFKKRIRGYNQAYYIAKGMRKVLELPIITEEAVVRIKNTKTQTGFSLEKRRLNIDQAFNIRDQEQIKDMICVIIDDVFTTGATAYELSNELLKSGASKTMIVTVAQA